MKFPRGAPCLQQRLSLESQDLTREFDEGQVKALRGVDFSIKERRRPLIGKNLLAQCLDLPFVELAGEILGFEEKSRCWQTWCPSRKLHSS